MTTFAFSIQNRVGGRVELCIGKFVRQRKQLGKINSFMVKASHLSRKDASKSTRRKIFFLSSFSPNFSALEIGGCCSKTRRASEEDVTLLIAFLQSRYRRRTLSRNVSSKGGQSGFPTNASLVTAADLMKLHLVKSNMRRSFALFASPP